ncbi:hypothetical protein NP233_g12378 [Leucocoprinus birnbaumii]|uniref:Nephrocystin 3-like N-terminal domain-containing protein n=1 Tax=Leucocoprinus birnbaumii TaxID=56174 RepID=A0AAD5VEI8_9AGAR|nr:hypothetical protein NP233_g12378 [Leucocoprinus birnbaumii]
MPRSLTPLPSSTLQHLIPQPRQIHEANIPTIQQSSSRELISPIPSIPTRVVLQQAIELHQHNTTLAPTGPPHSIEPESLSHFQPEPRPSSAALSPPSSLLPHSPEYRMFDQAHDLVIKNGQFTHVPPTGPGLDKLLENSMPDAFHDSLARHPPPKCHLGTRKEYISMITSWALGESEHKEPVLWMRGPFGIGKTAVAQSSAEALKPVDKLLATLFFSRSNSDRDDPRRVIPSIVYQITTLCESFAKVIDARVQKDRSLTTKSLETQFKELLVIPLSQIDAVANGLEGGVIIIDGLDECRGTAEQCEIIRIIATSARNKTTPFRWFITSRPEDPIIRTMNSTLISPVVHQIELPVSRNIDHEILLFLTHEFAKIRESHGLPESWPGEEVLALLVERGAGLWIYVSTIVRFIRDENSLGPEDQLRVVMEFIGDVSHKVEPSNPLAEMDFFYTLVMQRIPSNMLEMVKRIMLLHSMECIPSAIFRLLRISEEQLHRYCTFIQSVMELRATSPGPSSRKVLRLHFYHASFTDYLTDYSFQQIVAYGLHTLNYILYAKSFRLNVGTKSFEARSVPLLDAQQQNRSGY